MLAQRVDELERLLREVVADHLTLEVWVERLHDVTLGTQTFSRLIPDADDVDEWLAERATQQVTDDVAALINMGVRLGDDLEVLLAGWQAIEQATAADTALLDDEAYVAVLDATGLTMVHELIELLADRIKEETACAPRPATAAWAALVRDEARGGLALG
ncbi:MAG: hypothetical protein ACRD0C_11760 [Acidimicrobiia bacterium]